MHFSLRDFFRVPGWLLGFVILVALGCDPFTGHQERPGERDGSREIGLSGTEHLSTPPEIPVRVKARRTLSEAVFAARFPPPNGAVAKGLLAMQPERAESCFNDSRAVAVLSWSVLPDVEQAEIVVQRLQPVLSIVNVGTEPIQAEPRITADTGGPQEFFGSSTRLTLAPREEVELEIDLEGTGLDFVAMKFSGSVRASTTIVTETGRSLESAVSESLFFHPGGQGFRAYNENRLRAGYRSGDFAGRIQGAIPPGLVRVTDAGTAEDPPPGTDGDSGDDSGGDDTGI